MNVELFPPETRLSLIEKLQDASNDEAWSEFVDLYLPVIYRSARVLGIQDADAQDIAQQVLLAVANALPKRPYDPNRAKFRTWLSTITRNTAINLLQRRKPDVASGGSAMHRQLDDAVDPRVVPERILDLEFEKERFRAAARRIQAEFQQDSWDAFWMSTVEGKPIAEVAEQLNKRIGSVYAARSRIMRRLRDEIQQDNNGSISGDSK